MRTASLELPRMLGREESELRQWISSLRRQRGRRSVEPDPARLEGSNLIERAQAVATAQHDEVVLRRLADRSRAVTEALARVQEGVYGICRGCGGRIPRRRLEAMPTATLCVACQERAEADSRATGCRPGDVGGSPRVHPLVLGRAHGRALGRLRTQEHAR
jgi:DnaK suppressor protein